MNETLIEMAEAHLININREVQQLNQKKQDIDNEILRLQNYLDENSVVVQRAKSEAQAALASSATTPSSENNPSFPFKEVPS
mgnify:CR=1 FL=1